MIGFGKNDTLSIKQMPFLIRLEDGEEERLELTIALPVCGEKGSLAEDTHEGVQKLLEKCTPILPDDKAVYKITFEYYVIYQIRSESYCSTDKKEAWEGNFFRVFSHSALLDTLPQITDCQILADGSYYPDKWTHYRICCQSHIVDVIACAEPIIEKIDSE